MENEKTDYLKLKTCILLFQEKLIIMLNWLHGMNKSPRESIPDPENNSDLRSF